MPGCKGECSFSLDRENTILCSGRCKEEGYIESSEGICEKCELFNEGCYQCHYENSYPEKFTGIKRERRFVCDYCRDGYIRASNGNCISSKNKGKNCIVTSAILDGKCIGCNDVGNGGVENCKFCQENKEGSKAICKQCYNEYIMLSDNNTCLKRDSDKKLKEFNSCLELKYDKNKLICSRCKPQFSLIKTGNETKCIYIPTL